MRKRGIPLAIALGFGLAACGAPAPVAPRLGSAASSAGDSRILSEAEQDHLAVRDSDELTDQSIDESLWPSPPPDDLGNFGQVSERLFRGARPTEKGILALKEKGVNLIVNLENGRKVVEQERALAEKHGLRFKSLPMGIFIPPKVAKVDDFLATVSDPASVTYFHCMQGRDRTGTMAFCYRIKVDRWDTARAYSEMKQYKFHTYLLGLNVFVHWYGKKYGPAKVPAAPGGAGEVFRPAI